MLECFSVHGLMPFLVIFPFGYPHLLESVEGGQDGTPYPSGVKPLLCSRNLKVESKFMQSKRPSWYTLLRILQKVKATNGKFGRERLALILISFGGSFFISMSSRSPIPCRRTKHEFYKTRPDHVRHEMSWRHKFRHAFTLNIVDAPENTMF